MTILLANGNSPLCMTMTKMMTERGGGGTVNNRGRYFGISSTCSSFSLSKSTEIMRSMRRRPYIWLGSFLIAGIMFVVSLFWIVSWSIGGGKNAIAERTRIYNQSKYMQSISPSNGFWDGWKSRPRAVILVLCRNEDLSKLLETVRSFENRFNRKFVYPYVFLNDKEFDDEFKMQISTLIDGSSKAKIEFGLVPREHWSYPSWIDQERAAEARKEMERKGVLYGGSESYRMMCRYFSGFFYKHPLLKQYDYYWRIEPGVEFLCDINYDVFKFMVTNGKVYGFVITMQEIQETIPTLWDAVVDDFIPSVPRSGLELNSLRYFGIPSVDGYNGCHFWSNFEIASFGFFRSKEYQRFFETLDRRGGFFYERWGDAPVHSIAAGLFLRAEQIHYFSDIGYHHPPYSHCPADYMFRQKANCQCDPFDGTDISDGQCQMLWNINND